MIIGEYKTIFDAEVKGFVDASKDIHRAVNRTTRAFKNLTPAGQKSAQAYANQEIAMKKAWTRALGLEQSIKSLNTAEKHQEALLIQLGTVLSNYTRQLSQGALTKHEMRRAAEALSKEFKELGNQIRETQKAASDQRFGKLTNVFRNLESASVLAVGPLSVLGARIRSIGAIATRSNAAVAALFGTITAGLVGFFKLGQAAIVAEAAMAQVEARLVAASGSMRVASANIKYLKELALTLGVDFTVLSKSFSRFAAAAQGTSLEGKKAQKVFEGITRAGAALRLTGIEMEGIFRAVEQMMSKGTVQAEELRGQLGERLPGAFRLAAEAMGVNTMALNRMLKNGEVLAEDLLPKLASHLEETFGADAEGNANTLQGAINNLKTEFTFFANEVNDTTNLTQILVDAINTLTAAMGDLADNITLVIQGYKWLSSMSDKAALATVNFSTRLNNVAWHLFWANLRETGRQMGWLRTRVEDGAIDISGVFDWLENKWETAKDTINSFFQFSPGFQNTANDIQDLIDEIDQFNKASELSQIAGIDLEQALEQLDWQNKLTGSSFQDLAQVSWELFSTFGVLAIPTAEGLAKALAELAAKMREQKDASKGADKATRVLAEAQADLLEMTKRLNAMRGGEEQYRIYKEITSVVDDWVAKLVKAGIDEAQILELKAQYKALLISILALEEDMDNARERHKQTLKDEADLMREQERAQKRAADALDRANDVIDSMRLRISAMVKGPDSLMYFEKVELPITRMKQQLRDAKVEQTEITARAKEYRDLLEEQLRLSGPIAQSMDDIAGSIANAFGELVRGAKSVKDVFLDMFDAIYDELMKLLIVDPIKKQLSTALTDATTQGQWTVGGIFDPNWWKNLGGGAQQGPGPQGIMPGEWDWMTKGFGDFTKDVMGVGGDAAEATGDAAVQAQWQAILTQFQAILTQFQTAVTPFTTATTTFSTSVPIFQQASTTLLQAATSLLSYAQTQAGGEAAAGNLLGAATGTGGEGEDGGIMGLWQTNLAQEQGLLAQEQAIAAMNQSSSAIFQTGASTFMGGTTAFTSGAGIFTSGAAMMQGAATMHITAAGELIAAAFALQASAAASSSGSAMAMAKGGPIKPGRLYEVGEEGPEMLYMGGRQYLIPDKAGMIDPMDRASSGRRGPEKVMNITVNLPPQRSRYTATQTAVEVARVQNRAFARNS